MKGFVVVFIAILYALCSAADNKQCIQFEVVDPENLDPALYTVVAPNLILNQHNELVLTSPAVQDANFTRIQGVTYSYYGDPICIAIIDCGEAGTGSIQVSISNVQSLRVFSGIELKEICSNYGVFFGCVDTAFVPLNDTEPVPQGFVGGEFGDELVIEYTPDHLINGSVPLTYPIWLSCKELEYWDYELISTLMIEDALNRNIRKLQNLKQQILGVQALLFNNTVKCEDLGIEADLAPVAMESFEFLDCLVDRYTDATHFLSEVPSTSN